MSYIYQARVQVADTDATGYIYFAAMQRMALEAFENYLAENGFRLGALYLPIVHAEADYATPMRLWDPVNIHLGCSKIGESSFTIESDLGGGNSAKITHVCVDDQGFKQAITDEVKQLLEPLMLSS